MEGPSPRIVKETKTLTTDPVPGISFTPDPNNYKHFHIELQGIC
jgi:ubiquitin-protein ligase